MSAALQIYSRDFDADFFKLPSGIQARIQASIDQLGLQLATYSHHRMKGMEAFRIGLETTALFTISIVRKVFSTYWQWVIDARFIADEPSTVLSGRKLSPPPAV